MRVEAGANAFDIDVHTRQVEVLKRAPGELADEIGRLERFRRPLNGALDEETVRALLSSSESRALLNTVFAGATVDMLWSGDRLGSWTEDAFDAACALHEAVQGVAT